MKEKLTQTPKAQMKDLKNILRQHGEKINYERKHATDTIQK